MTASRLLLPVLLALAGLSAGCTINPVTGERQLALVSADDEIAIGEAQYLPSRQMQGGDYTRDPNLTRYVQDVGNRLAAVSDRNLPYEFTVLNSSVPNAWALPGGKIAINRGLLVELDSEAELAAVLGHEIVHAAARHAALAMQRGLLLQGAVLVTAAASRSGDRSGLVSGAAQLGAQLINMRYGREAELESDRFGMIYMSRAGYDPRAAISLQQTFLRLSEGAQNRGWLAGLFASHPPTAERVQQNRATAATLPASGEIGQDRYRATIAGLLRDRAAYEDYDAALAALSSGDVDEAERLGRRALASVPDEGQFHALLGDIELVRDDAAAAIPHFESAIAASPGYFYPLLRKADAHLRLRQWNRAESNYTASLSLLPTADAYVGLGRIAEQRGNTADALDQYRRAADSSGPAGAAARDAVVRLDLPANPGQYMKVDAIVDASGRLDLAIANPTAYDIADIDVAIRVTDNQGQTADFTRTIAGPLAAGSTGRFATRIGSIGQGRPVQATLVAARIVSR